MRLKRIQPAISHIAAATIVVAGPVLALVDGTRDSQWHLEFLNVTDAHSLTQGDGVVVAVIDSGVDAEHPDLVGNILLGADIVAGGVGNGHGDTDGHGTAMAALIAAHGHGATSGVLGIAPKAKILPVRVATSADLGDTSGITRGIEWAIDHEADVICIAGGGGTSAEQLQAVSRARQQDIVVVAGVGNRPRDTAVLSPARFQGVVAAAAIDRSGQHWSRSVTGAQVLLAAPGVGIVSAGKDKKYAIGDGTSSSTAIIAGAAALVRARFPDLTADEVVRRLTATADDKGPPGRDEQYGYGVLNIVAALTADIGPSPTTASQPTRPGAASTSPPGGRRSTSLALVLVVITVACAATFTMLIMVRRRRTRSTPTTK